MIFSVYLSSFNNCNISEILKLISIRLLYTGFKKNKLAKKLGTMFIF